jgi:tetratricopeptide (TPR) repeat protein
MSAQNTLAPAQQLKNIQNLIQQGAFAQAEKDISALLSTQLSQADQVACWYLLAVGHRLQQQHEQAITALTSLLAITPAHARAHQELGYNYRALQQGKQASIHFYKATTLNPALLSAWQALLPIYQQAKQDEATKLCEQQIRRLSSLPAPLLAATDLLHDGKVEEADSLCRRYLQEHKHSLEGLLLLADIAVALKATSEAEFILETCIELDPQLEQAKYQLYKIYSKLGKFEQALALTQELTEKAPNNSFYQVAKASSLVGVGDLPQAITIYTQALAKANTSPSIYVQLGHAYKTQGDIESSVAAYQQAYTLSSFYGDAYWSLANTKTYKFTSKEINTMLQGVSSNDVDLENKVHLHFALGKAYEDQKEYALSFTHYSTGNKLKSETLGYSSDKHARFVSAQIEAFTPELVASLANIGHSDPAPIFIVGLPRAGSTLLEQILASHSQVDGTMELHDILGLSARLSKKRGNNAVYPHNLKDIPQNYFAEFGKKFISDTQVYRQGGAYFIDKMPNNYMHIGLIKLILPNAKIIDARREPMACCFSGFKQLFGDGQEFTYSLRDLGLYYKNYVKLMDHWQGIFPEQILLVKHEDVVSDTENQVRRILDYCGLEFEQACLDFHTNKRAVNTPSAQQVRQPIYTSGLEQWKHFESYLDELKACFNDS